MAELNLEQEVMVELNRSKSPNSSIAVMVGILGLAGGINCGPIIRVPQNISSAGQSITIWYDCNTSEEYPAGHPCYDEVVAYNAKHATSSIPSTSAPSSSPHEGGSYREQYLSREHKICFPK